MLKTDMIADVIETLVRASNDEIREAVEAKHPEENWENINTTLCTMVNTYKFSYIRKNGTVYSLADAPAEPTQIESIADTLKKAAVPMTSDEIAQILVYDFPEITGKKVTGNIRSSMKNSSKWAKKFDITKEDNKLYFCYKFNQDEAREEGLNQTVFNRGLEESKGAELWTSEDKLRVDVFKLVSKALKGLDNGGNTFNIDHAMSLKNNGYKLHHPSNMQILVDANNFHKGADDHERFTFDEQMEYLKYFILDNPYVKKNTPEEEYFGLADQFFGIMATLKTVY